MRSWYLVASASLLLPVACGVEGQLGPTLGFVSPNRGEVVSGELVIALDDLGELRGGVAFYANDAFVDTVDLPPFESRLATTRLPDGPVQIVARSMQSLRTTPVDELTVIVDNHGPRVVFESPGPSSCVSSNVMPGVRARVSDDVTVRSVEVRLDGEPIAVFEGTTEAIALSIPGFGVPSATEYRLTIAAENGRGLISNQTTVVPVCE